MQAKKEREAKELEDALAGKVARPCCLEPKIVDHNKPVGRYLGWKPNFVWERNEFVLDPEKDREKLSRVQKLQMKRITKMRENQFRNFLADVFVQYDKGIFKNKISWNLELTKE